MLFGAFVHHLPVFYFFLPRTLPSFAEKIFIAVFLQTRTRSRTRFFAMKIFSFDEGQSVRIQNFNAAICCDVENFSYRPCLLHDRSKFFSKPWRVRWLQKFLTRIVRWRLPLKYFKRKCKKSTLKIFPVSCDFIIWIFFSIIFVENSTKTAFVFFNKTPCDKLCLSTIF